MIHGTRVGSAPAPLSVLDTALTGKGYTASDSLGSMVRRAELADRRGSPGSGWPNITRCPA